MEIGKTIKKLRKQKKIQQFELAKRSGISKPYLCQIENGNRIPTLETLEKISLVLNIPLPIMSFLSLDISTIQIEKRDAYLRIEPAIKAMVQEFFLQD